MPDLWIPKSLAATPHETSPTCLVFLTAQGVESTQDRIVPVAANVAKISESLVLTHGHKESSGKLLALGVADLRLETRCKKGQCLFDGVGARSY